MFDCRTPSLSPLCHGPDTPDLVINLSGLDKTPDLRKSSVVLPEQPTPPCTNPAHAQGTISLERPLHRVAGCQLIHVPSTTLPGLLCRALEPGASCGPARAACSKHSRTGNLPSVPEQILSCGSPEPGPHRENLSVVPPSSDLSVVTPSGPSPKEISGRIWRGRA